MASSCRPKAPTAARARGRSNSGSATSGTSEQLSERGRRLATVSEILADARADEQFVFVRGRKPLRCGRAIYFRRPDMAAWSPTIASPRPRASRRGERERYPCRPV